MKRKLTAGQTSVALPIFVQDTSSTTGGGLSGLTSATSGLVCERRRRGESVWTAITLQAKTLGTWITGGFVADGALAGAYELDLPDNVCASGARWVAIRLRGAANMLPVLIEIELDAFDYQTATQPVNTTQFAGQTITAAAGVTIPSSIASPTNITAGTITTVTTLTGHTPQTGDSFARIGALGAGLTSLSTQTSVDALGGAAAVTVERSITDTKAITFAWPVSGATITGTRSIDNADPYVAVAGAIASLRDESGKYYYTLAYNAADRPTAEGQVRYKFIDGTYTRYVVLRTATSGLDASTRVKLDATQPDYAPATAAALATVQSDTNDIQTRLPAALESGRIAAALDSATLTKINRIEAVATGTVTGAGTSTEVFVGPSATLTITVDASGNRSAVVVT